MSPAHSPTTNIPHSDLDPFARDVLIDPYATQAALRDAGPVVYLKRYGVYAMARHADVSAALQNWQTFSSARGVGIDDFAKVQAWRPKSILLETDPPLHDRTRRVLARVMSPPAMRNLRVAFKAKAEGLVDALVDKRTFDAVPELAEAYPLEVFPDAVGLRPDGRENLLPFSTMVFNSFGPRNALFDEATAAAQPVLAWIFAQCERDALSADGFGAAIWAAHDAGEITAEEAPILVRALLTAGLDTTVNGLANAIYAFTRHPEQWATLRADRTLIKPAFDEVLRWDAPVQIFFRTTTRAAILGDVTIPADAKVLLMLGAANRDSRHWPNADQFDVARRPIGHVALGAGIHACVGQLVARLEAELIFEALADRIVRFEQAGPVMHKPNNTLRGLGSLPVSVISA